MFIRNGAQFCEVFATYALGSSEYPWRRKRFADTCCFIRASASGRTPEYIKVVCLLSFEHTNDHCAVHPGIGFAPPFAGL